jgi:bifunctional oligoribonuclease and PAP phosphatase NrnA
MEATNQAIIDSILATEGNIAIACHRNPDGDTLGSGLAVFLWLKAAGRQVSIYCVDAVPSLYAFLPGAAEVSSTIMPCVLLLVVDTASPELLGRDAEQLLAQAKHIICIDHHFTNKRFGAENYVYDQAASTAEVIAELLLETGQNVTKDIADCLYTGIVTDTGRFGFDYTRPQSLRLAAALMERGARFEEIQSLIFRRRTLSKTRLLAQALSNLKLLGDGRLAVMTITLQELAACGASADEAESIVNFAGEVEGAEIGILLRETPSGKVKGSIRASGEVDVAALAGIFGGGGHKKAAGCTLDGPMENAEQQITSAALAAIGAL